MPKPAELSVETIVRAYVAHRGSASDAASDLGVDRRTVTKYLRSEEGQQRLAEYTGEVLDQYHVSAMRVVGEAAAIAFSDLPRILQHATTIDDLAALPPHHRAAISQVDVGEDGAITRLRLHGKLDALKVLAVYAEIAGMGAQPASESGPGKAMLGGLHITGPSHEVSTTDEQRPIPRPQKVD